MHVIFLPMIAAARENVARRDAVSDRLGGQTQLLALGMATGFAVVAPTMVTVLYGAKFTQSALVVGLVGILQTTRFLINWPSTVALSMGRSRTVLVGNLVRLLAYPGAFLGVALVGGLRGVLMGFIAGELIAIAASLGLLNRNMDLLLLSGIDRFAAFILTATAIVGWDIAIERHSIVAEAGLLIASMVLTGWIIRREMPTIREAIALVAQALGRRLTPGGTI